MKAVICSLILATLMSERTLAADVPSLVGTWTGQRDRIAKVEGRRGGEPGEACVATGVFAAGEEYAGAGNVDGGI